MNLAEALHGAHWPSLVPVLGRLTGEPKRFAHLLPERVDVLDTQGGMTGEQQREAYALALDVLSGDPDPPPVDDELARALLAPLLGRDLDAYAELAAEETGLRGPDPRAPAWRVDGALSVAVIGAGMSGLLAAHRLRQAGADVVVLEKNADLGGTWLENTYPGCRVDVPSHLYTYSFAPDLAWSEHYARQPEILDGFRRFARDTGVAPHIRFGTEVAAMEWDGTRWLLTTAGGDALVVDVVVNAVGQLNKPRIPEIPGRDRFRGPAFHSAAWDHDTRIDGARVAVIGTGSSAVQLIPPLAQRAGATTVFQRSPAWLIPTPDFADEVDPRLRWLFARVPGYQRWYRFWLLRRVSDALLPFATVDPTWGGPGSVSRANDRIRSSLLAYLEAGFAGRPDLLRHVVPSYPPFAKRAVRDDGSWARALTRPGVELVTADITEITADGVRTADGRHHGADVLVWGTGFHASRFLHPMRVHGRDGLDLHGTWDGEPSAHLGMTVPGFPDLFLLYGPNTNIVVNGSAVFFSECQVRHLLACLELRQRRGGAPIEPSQAAHDAWRARVDAGNAQRAWGVGGVRNWYRSASGRVSQNWPGTVLEYWELTRTADPADYPVRSG